MDDDLLADRRRHPLRSRLIDPPPETTRSTTPPPIEQRIAPRVPPAADKTGAAPAAAASRPAVAVPPAKKLPAARTSIARRIGSAFLVGLAGFVLGAVFWHIVGFWDFVGQVMFKGAPAEGQITQAPPLVKLRDRAAPGAPLAVVMAPTTCTSLVLDRASNATSTATCEGETMPLRSLKVARREDRWVTASQRIQEATSRGWSSSLTVEAPPSWRVEVQAAAD